MTTLLHHEHAVNVDCLSCGTTLLMPEVDGGLCGMCHAEVMSDMMSERELIEELTRQRDRLLAACRSALPALQYYGHPPGAQHVNAPPSRRQVSEALQLASDAIAATGEDSVPE